MIHFNTWSGCKWSASFSEHNISRPEVIINANDEFKKVVEQFFRVILLTSYLLLLTPSITTRTKRTPHSKEGVKLLKFAHDSSLYQGTSMGKRNLIKTTQKASNLATKTFPTTLWVHFSRWTLSHVSRCCCCFNSTITSLRGGGSISIRGRDNAI